jgi:hypothetical protein
VAGAPVKKRLERPLLGAVMWIAAFLLERRLRRLTERS